MPGRRKRGEPVQYAEYDRFVNIPIKQNNARQARMKEEHPGIYGPRYFYRMRFEEVRMNRPQIRLRDGSVRDMTPHMAVIQSDSYVGAIRIRIRQILEKREWRNPTTRPSAVAAGR